MKSGSPSSFLWEWYWITRYLLYGWRSFDSIPVNKSKYWSFVHKIIVFDYSATTKMSQSLHSQVTHSHGNQPLTCTVGPISHGGKDGEGSLVLLQTLPQLFGCFPWSLTRSCHKVTSPNLSNPPWYIVGCGCWQQICWWDIHDRITRQDS